jgi:hypothetical protein
MAKEKEETNGEDNIESINENAEPEQELTIEERVANIEKQAASIQAVNGMGQVLNNIGSVVEKLDLRTKLLEQQSGDFTEKLADRVVEKMVEYDKNTK